MLLVGDSLAGDEARTIVVNLSARGAIVTVDSRPGSGLQIRNPDPAFSWPNRLRNLVATVKPKYVIVMLGTNDARLSTQTKNYGEAVDREMSALSGLPVYWVPVNDCAFAHGEYGDTRAAEVNRALSQAQRRLPRLHVLPTNDLACAHVEWFVADGVHMNLYGQRDYGSYITRQIGTK